MKKHEAVISDVESYRSVIDSCREQAKACKVRPCTLLSNTLPMVVKGFGHFDHQEPGQLTVKNAFEDKWKENEKQKMSSYLVICRCKFLFQIPQ